jgi:hypothetical protein
MSQYVVKDVVREPLYVITPIFNPIRFKSRWKTYARFAQYIVDAGAVLYTIEAAFGDREHALQDIAPHGSKTHAEIADLSEGRYHSGRRGEHCYLKVRTKHEIWMKEGLINLAMRALPRDWKFCAWVDADVTFARPNIVGETIHQLQHYDLVQMFSHYQDVGPDYGYLTPPSPGFAAFYTEKREPLVCDYYGVKGGKTHRGRGAPGLAWAARRSAIDALGGLLDVNIVGAGDWYMAHGLIGKMDRCLFPGITAGYKRHLREWERRAEKHIRRNIGAVSGLALHQFHGPKRQRGYQSRMSILRDNKFDPDYDLTRDFQGLLQLVDRGTPRSIALRDQLREYARSRNEDSNEA